MQITVDTKHDSHEEIRRVIAILEHLVGDKKIVSNAPELISSPLPSTESISSDPSSSLAMMPTETDAPTSDPSLNDLFSVEDPLSEISSEKAGKEAALSSLASAQPSVSAKKSEEPFSDLFTMDDVSEKESEKEEESDEGFSPSKKPKIEFY